MKRFKPILVLSAASLVAVLGIWWNLTSPASASEGESTPPGGGETTGRLLAVETHPVEFQQSYQVEDRYMGEVEAARRSQLGFELAGTVDRVTVDEGDAVSAGQVLAELDKDRLLALRGEQLASLAEAEANLTQAAANFRRVSRLADSGAVSSQELDEATRSRDTAKAAVQRAEAGLQRIDVDLSKSTLDAPYPGRISARMVDEGAIVAAGQGIIELLESDALEARVGITPEAAREWEAGDSLTLERVGSDGTIASRIRQIAPQQDRRSRTVDLLLTLDESASLLQGDLVELAVPATVVAEGSWLPREALTSSARGLWGAFVALPTDAGSGVHRLERRLVEVIHLDADRAYVRGALTEGDLVVTAGLHRLVPDQKVRLAQP